MQAAANGATMAARARPIARRRSRVRRRWLVAAVIVLIAFLYSQPLRTYLRTRDALARRTAEVHTLETQRRSLDGRLSQSLRGPGLLRQARRIGFVRPGERLFIVKGIENWRREQGKSRGTIRGNG